MQQKPVIEIVGTVPLQAKRFDDLEVPPPHAGRIRTISAKLDVKGWTEGILVSPGQLIHLGFSGSWRPGIRHPCWSANGSPDRKLNGVNKWCVLILIVHGEQGRHQDLIQPSALEDGTRCHFTNTLSYLVNIGFLVNDDKYDDNEQCDPSLSYLYI